MGVVMGGPQSQAQVIFFLTSPRSQLRLVWLIPKFQLILEDKSQFPAIWANPSSQLNGINGLYNHIPLPGARVLSAETVPMQLMPAQMKPLAIPAGGGLTAQPEFPYSYHGGKHGASWLIGIRVFLDGIYQDPPPEALPPVPVMAQAAPVNLCCCAIL